MVQTSMSRNSIYESHLVFAPEATHVQDAPQTHEVPAIPDQENSEAPSHPSGEEV